MRLAAGSYSDAGRVREGNEDAHVVDDRLALFAVADGMGGHRGGEVASRTAIEALRAAVASGQPVNGAIARANDAVLARAAGDDELAGMGTTLTAAVVAGGRQLLVGHVGDSRAYLLHAGDLRRITEDHSLVEEMVREGRLTPEQAEAHPQRAIITRALGVEPSVDVDVYTVEVDVGDRMILCSDGLTTMVRDRDVERIARAERDPQRVAEALVDAANDAGGEDNITVVVLDVLEVEAPAPPDPEELAGDEAEAAPAALFPSAPEPDPVPPAPSTRERSRWRAVRGAMLVVVPVLVIVGLAAAAVGWYARRSYYVGADRAEVVIYKGVPGGVLVWDATVEQRTGLRVDDLPEVERDRVTSGAARGSLDGAKAYVVRLRARVDATTTTSTTTSTATTSTSVPATPNPFVVPPTPPT